MRVPGRTCFNFGSWVLSTLSPGFIVCGARRCFPSLVLRPSGVRFGRSMFCVLCFVFSILYSVLCVSALVLPGPQCSMSKIQLRSLDPRPSTFEPSGHPGGPNPSLRTAAPWRPCERTGTRDEGEDFASSVFRLRAMSVPMDSGFVGMYMRSSSPSSSVSPPPPSSSAVLSLLRLSGAYCLCSHGFQRAHEGPSMAPREPDE